MTVAPSFRQRLVRRERLIATFVKTTSHQTVEVLGATGLDAVVLDAEHAPFGPESLDRCLGAAVGVGLPALVRVPAMRAEAVLQALDMGACGVLVPHVDDAEQASEAVSAARYVGGRRGYSASARAGAYGDVDMRTHLQNSDEGVAVIAQIESTTAVRNARAIASVPGVDCLFIGPADLAVSLGAGSMADERVHSAIAEVCTAARDAGCAVGSFVPDAAAMAPLAAQGVSFFVMGSDQSWLKRMARQLVAQAREPEQGGPGQE
jgi:2-keto-3-deoxy-L-rhamnonate aldolase RhmA